LEWGGGAVRKLGEGGSKEKTGLTKKCGGGPTKGKELRGRRHRTTKWMKKNIQPRRMMDEVKNKSCPTGVTRDKKKRKERRELTLSGGQTKGKTRENAGVRKGRGGGCIVAERRKALAIKKKGTTRSKRRTLKNTQRGAKRAC